MEIKYFINPSIKTVHTVEQIIPIVKNYKKKYNLNPDGVLKSIQLNPQFNVQGNIAWIVTEEYLFLGQENDYSYVISDQTGLIEFTLNEHGTHYPHLEKEKTVEEIARDEDFLQKLRDEGFDIIE